MWQSLTDILGVNSLVKCGFSFHKQPNSACTNEEQQAVCTWPYYNTSLEEMTWCDMFSDQNFFFINYAVGVSCDVLPEYVSQIKKRLKIKLTHFFFSDVSELLVLRLCFLS